MTWTLVGWVFIGCAAVLLLISIFIRFENRYPIRQMPAIAHLRKAQSASMETGRGRWVLLGDRFIRRLTRDWVCMPFRSCRCF